MLLGVLPVDPHPNPLALDDLINVWDNHAEVSRRMWAANGLGEQVAAMGGGSQSERFCVPYGWRADRHPSAYLLRNPAGRILLYDHGGEGHPYDAAHFSVCKAYRRNVSPKQVKLVLSVYRVRLMIQAGVLRPADVEIPPCPNGFTPAERKVYDGVKLLAECKGRVKEWAGNPFPMSKEFMAAWCQVSDKVARNTVNKLADLGVIHVREMPDRGPWLWLPGPYWWRHRARRIRILAKRPEDRTPTDRFLLGVWAA